MYTRVCVYLLDLTMKQTNQWNCYGLLLAYGQQRHVRILNNAYNLYDTTMSQMCSVMLTTMSDSSILEW